MGTSLRERLLILIGIGLLVWLFTGFAQAQNLTRVTGTIATANNSDKTGSLKITWATMRSTTGVEIVPGGFVAPITAAGKFDVRLKPATATYKAEFNVQGQAWVEQWLVPETVAVLDYKTIRRSSPLVSPAVAPIAGSPAFHKVFSVGEYSTGLASRTFNSTSVSGTGTSWSGSYVGWWLVPIGCNGKAYKVFSVASTQALTTHSAMSCETHPGHYYALVQPLVIPQSEHGFTNARIDTACYSSTHAPLPHSRVIDAETLTVEIIFDSAQAGYCLLRN